MSDRLNGKVAVVTGGGAGQGAAVAGAFAAEGAAVAVVDGTCLRCHNDTRLRGNLSLQSFEVANAIDGALGASVLGLMQDFVFHDTGLAERLQTFVPEQAKLIFFPGDEQPTRIFRDPQELGRELRNKWGESGDLEAFRTDEAKVVSYLQDGYREARPPSIAEAESVLGKTLSALWIKDS